MERLTPEIEKLCRAKEQRRARFAALPYPEKVRAVVQMQRVGRGGGQHGQPYQTLIHELPEKAASRAV